MPRLSGVAGLPCAGEEVEGEIVDPAGEESLGRGEQQGDGVQGAEAGALGRVCAGEEPDVERCDEQGDGKGGEPSGSSASGARR